MRGGLLVGLWLIALSSVAQHARIVDSLSRAVNAAGNDTTRVLTMVELSLAQYRSLPDTAIAIALQAEAIALKLNYPKGIARACNAIGLGYWIESRNSEALSYFEKSIPYFESAEDPVGYGLALKNIGIIYHYQHDYRMAQDYYLKALGILEKVKNYDGVALVYNNLGLNYEALGDLKRALDYYLRALRLNEQTRNRAGVGQSLTNIGYVYFTKKDYAEALRYQERAVAIQEDIADQSTLISSLICIAQIHQAERRYAEGTRVAERAYRLARGINSLMDSKEALDVLYRISKEQNDPARALIYFERSKELNDSIFSVENNKVIASLEERISIEKKQKEIEMLERQKNLREKINYLTLAVLAGVVGFTFLVVRNRRKLQNAYGQLEEINRKLVEVKKEVEVQAEMLKKSNSTKDKIFSIVSHDLRSPMLALKGIFHLIENDNLNLDEFKKLIPDLTKRVTHAADIMDELLLWSQSQLEAIEPSPTSFNINDLLCQKADEFKGQAQEKGVDLVVDCSKPAWVCADIDMIKTVIRNLVSNAIKFCRQGDTITLVALQLNDWVEIKVTDTGVGITAENLPKLFVEQGFSTYGTALEKGTGLGLMLCREFIQKNGGNIWAQSEMGRGATIRFTLPANIDS